MTPWFVFVLLVLTAYRGTRLIVRDTFPPVLWLRDRLAGGWRPLTGAEQERYAALNEIDKRRVRERWAYDPEAAERGRYVRRAPWSPHWLAELITCPWCASAYVSGALVAVTDLTYGLPVPWLTGPAVWAGASLLAGQRWA
jgi:hypothetical protein